MIGGRKREYIKNRLINSIKIKYIYKLVILKSIVNNKSLLNLTRSKFFIKYKFNCTLKTTLNDLCYNSAMYKKSSKNFNFSRYEFHNLCRTNKLSG